MAPVEYRRKPPHYGSQPALREKRDASSSATAPGSVADATEVLYDCILAPNRDPGTNRNKRLTNLRKSARRGVPIGADRAPS
jgi:hypothetical protein